MDTCIFLIDSLIHDTKPALLETDLTVSDEMMGSE
jgi:hypothetical protein